MNAPAPAAKQRLVVGISGASGVILGIRLLEYLQHSAEYEAHLVLSAAAKTTMAAETDWAVKDVEALAAHGDDRRDVGEAPAGGPGARRGMVIIPASIKTLSGVANSYAADLLTRAADVTLKEGRPLILVLRETPFHLGHLRLMQQAAEAGAVIFPPVPAFYARPRTVDDIIDNTVGRVLFRLGIENELFARWQGLRAAALAKRDTPPGA